MLGQYSSNERKVTFFQTICSLAANTALVNKEVAPPALWTVLMILHRPEETALGLLHCTSKRQRL